MSGECIAMQQRDQALMEKAKFEMALRVKRVLGLEQALLICDFSREELENEKLNRQPYLSLLVDFCDV